MTVNLLLGIDTYDKNLLSDIFNTPGSFSTNSEIAIPGGAKIISKGLKLKKAFGFPQTIELILSFGTGVASGLVASWIFQKLKGRTTSFRIDRTEVKINKGEIEKIIIEKIKKE